MFSGKYSYKVDEKGRLPLPPKFRREMREGVMLAKPLGTEKCVAVYSLSEWKRLADSLATKPVTPANLRKVNRALFGSAFSASLDGQGRIALPWELRDYAEIGDTVIVVGANTCVELWNEDLWEVENASAEEQKFQTIEDFGTQ